jgi:conserved oligomeric Golgi complex subunit 4
MTTFYFRRSVEKAFQLDEQPQDLTLNMNKIINNNPPHITSAVDDVMYIVDQVLQRTLSTSQRSIIASVVPAVSRVLSSDFIGMIQRKMRDESYPKPAIQGGLPPEHTIVAFLVLLNNLDVSADYIKRIISSKLETPLDALPTDPSAVPPTPGSAPPAPPPSEHLRNAFPFSHDAVFVGQTLYTLHTSFYTKTAELLADGIFVVFRNVMKPRLRPILTDTFRDIDYALSADEVEELNRLAAENDDSLSSTLTDSAGRPLAVDEAIPIRFQYGWDALTRPLRRVLTGANWERLLGVTAGYLAEVLEKRVWGYFGKVNGLGAARLERDVDRMVGIVVKSGTRYALREEFARCTQICLVMNMEEEEWEEVRAAADGGADMDWKIDAEERVRARGMIKE